MIQQLRQSMRDGQPQAQPPFAPARRVVDLVIFFKNCPHFLVGNPDSGVADIDAQNAIAPSAAQQNLAAFRVFQRV